jgi:hypothetical protein
MTSKRHTVAGPLREEFRTNTYSPGSNWGLDIPYLYLSDRSRSKYFSRLFATRTHWIFNLCLRSELPAFRAQPIVPTLAFECSLACHAISHFGGVAICTPASTALSRFGFHGFSIRDHFVRSAMLALRLYDVHLRTHELELSSGFSWFGTPASLSNRSALNRAIFSFSTTRPFSSSPFRSSSLFPD